MTTPETRENPSTADANEEQIDLWRIATELALTPKGQDRSTRAALRTARHSRAWFWIAFIAGLALALLGGAGAVIGIRETESGYFQIGFLLFAVGTPFCMSGALSLLSANTFRQLGSLGRRVIVPLWWVFTVLSYLFALITALGFSATVWIAPANATSLAGGTLLAALMSVMCSMLASSSAQPLVSTAVRPRLYQALGSQFCWTVSLLALLLSGIQLVHTLVRVLEPPVDDSIAVPILISVGIAVGTSILAWHRRCANTLEERRIEVIDALLNALRAVREHGPGIDTQDALLRLETVVRPSPFRAQSPAAPPQNASWEIVQLTEVLLHAVNERDFPESFRLRTHHEGQIGQLFTRVMAASGTDVIAAAPVFLARAHRRLLSVAPNV